jgi:charged multivesicular body protein 7
VPFLTLSSSVNDRLKFTAMKAFIVISLISILTIASSTPAWNDLRVTFGVNPFSKWDFDELPRDTHGDMQSFTLKDDQCTSGKGLFVGKRYWYGSDPAVLLIFDINGYIAGIQTSVPKSDWQPAATMVNKFVIDEGDMYTETVYFVDPSTICKGGRTADQYASQGTGTDLYIQTGPDPLKDIFQVPVNEADIKPTKWGHGKCFWGMGQHYWYNVSADMPCANFVPYCLLYNDGKLNAFCFSINAGLTSERYEHPTATTAKGFMDPVPDCFSSDPTYSKLSTMHVYLTSNYLGDRC